MDEDEAKRLSLQLMEIAWTAYLATIDANGFPHIRAMDNLRNKQRFPKLIQFFKNHKDDFRVLFSTNTSSAKVNQIKKNPRVSVYYCNRGVNCKYCKQEGNRGLMLRGIIKIVEDPNVKKALWHDYWVMYYPQGVDDPEYTVLSLYPVEGRYYQSLQSVTFTLKENKLKV